MFVNDDNLAILDDVVHITLEQGMGTQRGVNVMQQGDVTGGEEGVLLGHHAILLEQLFYIDLASFGEQGLTRLFIYSVMTCALILF